MVIFSDDVLSVVSNYPSIPTQLKNVMPPSICPSIFIQLLRQRLLPLAAGDIHGLRLTEKAEDELYRQRGRAGSRFRAAARALVH